MASPGPWEGEVVAAASGGVRVDIDAGPDCEERMAAGGGSPMGEAT
jgi:hypothetical protein